MYLSYIPLIFSFLIMPFGAVQGDSLSGPVTWGELLGPERLARGIANYATLAVRTGFDFTYENIDIDIRNSEVTLSEAHLRPFPDGHPRAACEVEVARLTLAGVPLANLDQTMATVMAEGARLSLDCLPPEALPFVAAAGLDSISTDLLRAHIVYDMPSGGAAIELEADFPGLVALNARGEFEYIGMALNTPFFALYAEDPYATYYGGPSPYADLSEVEVTLEDQGLWDVAQRMLPPDTLKPDTLAFAVSKGLSDMLTDTNGGVPLNAAQRRIVQQAADVARGLPDGPREVVLTMMAEGGALRLGDKLGYMPPTEILAALNPNLRLGLVDQARMIPVADLAQAQAGGAGLSDEARERIGLALLDGVGAPRDVVLASELLEPLAASDASGGLAMRMAEALAPVNPERAYQMALKAGVNRAPGSLALMDRLEEEMSFERIIALQPSLPEAAPRATSRAALRSQARQAYIGHGTPRSYAQALYWAELAAIAGDSGARAIAGEVQARIARADGVVADLLPELEARIAADWIAADLPARLTGQ